MAQPGWYDDPDPRSAPGTLRWWDGVRWSDATQSAAGDGWQPAAAGSNGTNGPGRRSGPLLGVLAALLVLALLAGLWWHRSRSASAPEDQNTAAPSVSAWNESASSTATASSSGVRPTASGKPVSSVPCPSTAKPRGTHPADGRLHGGGLVVDVPRTFTPGPLNGAQYIGDQAVAVRPVTTDKVSFLSLILVGSLDRTKFGSLENAAQSMLTCLYSPARADHVTVDEQVVVNEATTLQGHPAWYLRENASQPPDDKHPAALQVEVVDLGGQQYGLYWTEAMTSDATAVQLLVDSRSTLTVGA